MKEHEHPYWTKDKKHPVDVKHETKYTSKQLGEMDAYEAQPGDTKRYKHADYNEGWKGAKAALKEERARDRKNNIAGDA